MSVNPIPTDELARLRDLHDYELLDTPAEQAYDDLVKLASVITGRPVSLISLVDVDRQWLKATIGVDLTQTPRDIAFCRWTILGRDLLVVPDTTADPRFAGNPLVTGGPRFRFYAGAPLVTPAGHAVGTLCVLDTVPGQLTPTQADALRALAQQVLGQMQLRRTITQLAASERQARNAVDGQWLVAAIIDSSDDAIISKMLDGTITTWNNGAERIFGWSAAEAIGRPVTILIPADRLAEQQDVLARIGRGERVNHFETVRQTKAGRQIDVSVTISPVRDGKGRITRFSKVARDITAQKEVERERQLAQEAADRAMARLRHYAGHDALTGLPNRVLFAERVDRCIGLARRHGQTFAVLFLDLDRFKIINDSLGHAAGDRLLTTVAHRIARSVRPTDYVAAVDREDEQTVARMGGDEFTVLLEHLSGPADAARVAERVRDAIAQPVDFEGHELMTTASIGIVTCGHDGTVQYDAAKDVIRDADAAMYKAKAAGKDRYVLFDQTMHAEVVARMTLEADLRRAVGRGELELHYQPIVTLGIGGQETGVAGFEALVRWRRNGQLVSPAHFIPVAEDTGLILPIGTWVLRQACRQLAEWRAGGGPMAGLYVTINVSRRQLADPGLLAIVQNALRETGLPGSAIGLEITESAVMDDPAAAEKILVALTQQTGVRLSVDDFGTGYSSLSCLQRFPIDLLKIDRSFVSNVAGSRRDAAVMRTIIRLAHDLDMRVVAEGIEQAEQALFLSTAQCDLVQGYLFSRPLEPAMAERFVRDRQLAKAG